MWCNYCDPKHFVIYGFCDNCKRRCEPPLFDPSGDISLPDWHEFRRKWNQERSDFMTDVIRRMPQDELGRDQS
jgi:hypothetical protein